MITKKSKSEYCYYKEILKYFFYILFCLSHIILLLILSYVFKCDALMLEPRNDGIWSDGVGYWREIFSFANYGFKTGYIGINELIPKFSQFSTHSFFPALFYYPFAKLLNSFMIIFMWFLLYVFLVYLTMMFLRLSGCR